MIQGSAPRALEPLTPPASTPATSQLGLKESGLAFTAPEVRRLERALRALLSPLESPSVNAWRSRVNGEVQHLLGADMVTFHLPIQGAPEFYSEQLSPASLRAYPAHRSRLETRFSTVQRSIALGVYSRAAIYYPHWKDVERSEYYNEFIVPNRAYDAIAITIATDDDARPGTVSGLLLYHDRPRGRRFGRRGLALLRLLLPAFRSGVRSCLRFETHRGNLAAAVDGLAEGVVLANSQGHVLHRNPALAKMLELDPERGLLTDRMEEVAGTLAAFQQVRRSPDGDLLVRPMVSDVRTTLAHYRVRGTFLPWPCDGDGSLMLIAAERLSGELVSPARLQERWGLTGREGAVALFLAQGRSNTAIAAALGISPHTVRHHTESVLAKLGVHSRDQVAETIGRAAGVTLSAGPAAAG